MPRRYTLGRRAELSAETRARIVAAALELVRTGGMASATTPAVARAADVAPGTVRNHFPDSAALGAALLDAVLAMLRPPGPEIFEGVDDVGERLTRLARELAAFYDRSEGWWEVYRRDAATTAAWADRAAQFERDQEALYRAALGPLADDEEALAIVSVVVGPPLFFSLRGRGFGSDTAMNLALDLVLPWLRARAPR